MNDRKKQRNLPERKCGKGAPEESKRQKESIEYEDVQHRTERILQNTSIGFGPASPERMQQAQAAAWAKIESRIARRAKIVRLYRSIAASAAAVLIVGLVSLHLFRNQPEMLVMENTGDEVCELMLADSTHVWLQRGAKITYPEKFSRKSRPVQLSGEAFFDVTRDPARPFTVSTAAAEIKVLGTRFDVRTATDDTTTEVALESGSVALRLSGPEDEFVKIRPGDLAVADLHDASITVTQTDPDMYSVWKEKVLVFRSLPLSYIMQMLGKAYGVDIRLENDALGQTIYTGKFKKSLPIEEILEIIEMNTTMEHRVNADGSIDIR